MSEPRKPPPPPKRPEAERRRRFAWTGDDILHLAIDGQVVRSTPRDDE